MSAEAIKQEAITSATCEMKVCAFLAKTLASQMAGLHGGTFRILICHETEQVHIAKRCEEKTFPRPKRGVAI